MDATETVVTGKLTVDGLIDPTGLQCIEQASNPGSVAAGNGTYWVQDDAPNVPAFTDDAGTDHVISYLDSVSLSNVGTTSLVNDGTGPTLAIKGLFQGAGILFGTDANNVSIANSSPATSVTLTNIGTTTLVNDGVGPALVIKGLNTGTGISFATDASNVQITNSKPSIFEYSGLVVRPDATNSSYNINSDFVFGSQQLNGGFAGGDIRMIFDKSNGSFRVGDGGGTTWDTRGEVSFSGGGLDIICSAPRASSIGGAVNSITGTGSNHTAVGGFLNTITSSGTSCNVTGTSSSNITGSGSSNGIYGGDDHDIVGTSTRCIIAGGNDNIIQTGQSNTGIIGGTLHQCNGTNSFMGGGNTNTLVAGNTTSGIIGGTSCTINSTADCFIGGGSTCTINNDGQSAILGGLSNAISAPGGNGSVRCTLIGGLRNTIGSENGSIIGGTDNLVQGGTSACDCVIVGGNDNTIDGSVTAVFSSAILSGASNNISNGVINSVILGGSGGTITHDNCFMFCAGGGIASTVNNQFSVKATGQTRFISNAGNTTGVVLNAGSNSWAAISDVNKKENLVELNHRDVMLKVSQIPIYKYNMIGCDAAQIDIGPTAQDWHGHFGAPLMDCEVLDETGNVVKDPETGDPLMAPKPAKDPLVIEDRDMIGVLMSCVKDLHNEIEILKQEISELRAKTPS